MTLFLSGQPATPDDVYRQVLVLQYLVTALCAIVVLQIFAKYAIWRKVFHQTEKVTILLEMAEKHGELTDAHRDQAKQALEKAVETTQEAVRIVGEVATAVAPTNGGSGIIEMHGPKAKAKDGS